MRFRSYFAIVVSKWMESAPIAIITRPACRLAMMDSRCALATVSRCGK